MRCSKSETSVADGSLSMNSVSQLLMESVIPSKVRAAMKEAIEVGTFGYEYEHLVRVKNFSHLSNYRVYVLMMSMMASQRFIKAALRCNRAKISDRGFIRLMNNTTRLALDRMAERKPRNKFNEHVHDTISEVSRKQWLELLVKTRANATARAPHSSGTSSSSPRVSENEARGSSPTFYWPHSDSSSTSDSGLTDSSSVSEESLPPAPEDPRVITLELESDAVYGTSCNDIVGVGINDPSMFHHEEIVADAGECIENVTEAPIASPTSPLPSHQESGSAVRAEGAGRKRKLCSPVTNEDVKRIKDA
ncbi:uncharacterized protein [Watersipora subatra]|uniref:uncharacterized protein n=1 Tax=Watersipora subatra TaxID=2589382 RepID=UPI00355BFCCB